MSNTETEIETSVEKIGGTKELTVVPSSELDGIYRSGKVSPDVQGIFKASLDRSLSTQGMSIDQFIETNRRIKIEMKEYLENYKIQRSLMESVIYYLKNPDEASLRIADKVGGFFGRKWQLEAKRIANNPYAIRQLFEEMALSVEQSRRKTLELEKQALALYNASLIQRENIEKDITIILQNISVNKDTIIKLEDDYNKVKDNVDKLLRYMQEKLAIEFRGDKPVFEDVDIKKIESPEETLSYEARIDRLINEDKSNIGDAEKAVVKTDENIDRKEIVIEDPRIKEKKKIQVIKLYYSLNGQLVKAENDLRDARSEKLVLHQNYEKAKENLTLYDRVLINQVNEARNYFSLLFSIFDAEVKYTLPSARLIAHLASLQEIVVQLTQQIYDSRNIFNNLLDSVTQGALEIQEGIITLALNPSWDPVKIDQADNRTIELAKRTREFAKYMDKRLTEIEMTYRDANVQKKLREKPALDSGIDDEYLKKLLT